MAKTCKALTGMGSLKAPRLDGYHPIFFKTTWEITSPSLHSFAQGVLSGGDIPLEVMEALLVHIPKEEKPASIRGFIPISLCNVCVKLVSKMIVNQLKEVLNDIVTQNQASFIPGRQNIDNILIC